MSLDQEKQLLKDFAHKVAHEVVPNLIELEIKRLGSVEPLAHMLFNNVKAQLVQELDVEIDKLLAAKVAVEQPVVGA